MSTPKPKHPMEVLARMDSLDIFPDAGELAESVRHYFSPENMPSDLDIKELASKEFEYDDEAGERQGYFLGYKEALERMKR